MNVVRSRRSARYRMALLTMVVIAFGAITTIATATEIGPVTSPDGPGAASVIEGLTNVVATATTKIDADGDLTPDGITDAALSAAPRSQATSTLVYSTSFETGADSNWDNLKVSTSAPTSQFLGNFTNDTVTLTLTNLPRHRAIELGWDLLVIDSWDGSSTSNGPDYWGFSVTGLSNPTFETTFPSTIFSGQPEVTGHLYGSTSFTDNIYRGLSRSFPHFSDTLKISFYGRNLQAISDESWGLDNVKVKAVLPPAVPVAASAPSNVLAGSLFSASMDSGTVSGLHKADYIVSYDPDTLTPVGVGDGEIGGKTFPVDDWNILSPGMVNIKQSVASTTIIYGAGPLAHLFFNATSTVGASTTIDFVNASSSLTHRDGDSIPSDWTGTKVTVIPGIGATAQVALNAPPDVRVDSLFLARVDIANVANLNAANYKVTFNPSVLKFLAMTDGNVGGTNVPAGLINIDNQAGTVAVIQEMSGLNTVSGSGYLGQLRFQVIGAEHTSSAIAFDTAQGALANNLAEAISAQWANTNVRVTAHQTANLGIGVSGAIGAGAPFIAKVTTSNVNGLDAANYEVLFDSTVLRLDQITAGTIGGTAVPVDLTNQISPGRVAIVQDVPGNLGATGSGHLSEIRFTAIGAIGSSSGINLADVTLSDVLGERFPLQWTGATVNVVDPSPPKACTVPEPPGHDFGEVVVGTKTGFAFELKNCGEGTLTWSIASDSTWASVGPKNGTTTLESDTITVQIDTTTLKPDVRHTANVTITSDGGTVVGTVAVTPREFPTDLTVTNLTWTPTNPSDGQTVTFSADIKNQGDRGSAPTFQVGFDVNGQTIGQPIVSAGLAIGQTKTVTQTWVAKPAATTTATTTVTVTADVNKAVSESDETNNVRSATTSEILSPDLRVTKLTWNPTTNISHSQIVNFTATVSNTSTAATVRNFFVALQVDGTTVSTQVVNGLGASSTALVNLAWSAKTFTQNVKAIVDSTDVVLETREDNNSLTVARADFPAIKFADLIITEIDSAALPRTGGIVDGGQARFTATIQNIGTGDVTGSFAVRFEVIGIKILGQTTVTSGLASGATTTVASPSWTATPGSFNVRATADVGLAIAEAEENNNVLARTVPTVGSSDLVVTKISQSPTNPADGQTATLTATLQNNGSSTARNFNVAFDIGGTAIGSAQTVTGGLNAGSTSTVSVAWTTTPGTTTVRATADSSNQVSESKEANNQLSQMLNNVPFSDLTVEQITRDLTQIGDGQKVTFTATVKNSGGTTHRAFRVRFNIGVTSIGDVLVANGLAAGATTQVSRSWVGAPGLHVVSAKADQFNDVAESNEINNKKSEALPLVASSDLKVSNTEFGPSGVQDGEKATITATIQNAGNGLVARDFYVRFEVDGKLIGRQKVVGGIQPTKTVQVTQTWTANAGDHPVKVIADEFNTIFESNEGNNSATANFPSVPFSDLKVTGFQWTPATFSDGETVTITATIANTGAGDTARSFAARFEIDSAPIGTKVVSGGVAKNGTTTVTQSWVASGGNHEVALSVDLNNNVIESEENNNRTAKNLPNVPKPNLKVGGVDWSPTSFKDGDTIVLTASTTNDGAGDTLRAFTVRFEIDGVHIGTETVPGGLAKGKSAQVTRKWTVTTGQHTVSVLTDSGGSISESNELDNVLNRTMPTVAQADLTITSVAMNSGKAGTVTAGDNVTLEATVKNIGTGATSRSFLVDFQIDGRSVGRTRYGSGLDAGSSVVVSRTWKTTPGTHQLLGYADIGKEISESNESNNSFQAQLPAIGAPDLTVGNISVTTNATSGQQIQVSWTLTNLGQRTATGSWNDQLFLSTDNKPGGDQYFGSFRFTGTLDAGKSIVRSQPITLPLTISGKRWVIVRTDTAREIVESNDNNNTTVDDVPIDIALSAFPNLKVTSVTTPPSAFSQQTTLIEWQVKNEGTGATNVSSWHDGVWMSLDKNLDSLDTFLGSAPNSSSLKAGESYNNKLTVSIPRGTEGDHFFIVRTDTFSRVFEFQAENDNLNSGGPTDIKVPPQPDLQVTTVNAPSTAFSGQPMNFSWVVTNKGQAGTGGTSWHDNIFMSADDILDSNDRHMVRVTHYGALAAGGSYSGSKTLNLPIAVIGDYYFFVVTDSSNHIYEHGLEGNNTSFDQTPTKINLTPPPDLEVENVDAPATAVASQPLTFSYRVANNGSTITPNSYWKDEFFLSVDTKLDSGDRSLGVVGHSGALKVGDSYTRTVSFTLPTGLNGSFFVFAKTDRDDAVFEGVNIGSNTGFDTGAVNVCACPPDLVVDSVNAPDAVLAGHPITITYTVSNSGAAPTPNSSWRDIFYLSKDGALDGNDHYLGGLTHRGALGVGSFYNGSAKYSVPNGISGDYQVIVKTDSANQVFEGTAESNNTRADSGKTAVTSRPADLQVSSASAPSTAEAGTGILVEWTVLNNGLGDTIVSRWKDRVVASTDLVVGNDIFLGEFEHNGLLTPGQFYQRSQVLALPFNLSGQYLILIISDYRGDVYEGTNEGNNTSPALPLQITQPAKFTADLQVTGVAATSTQPSGSAIAVSWTVKNLGQGTTNANYWHDEVYLSADGTISGDDKYLGRVRRYGVLAPQGQYTVNRSFNLPRDLTGNFKLIVRTDSYNRVLEGDKENNNDRAATGVTNIFLSSVPDLVLDSIDGPVDGVSGQSFVISWTVTNKGGADASGNWYDAFYLSLDQVFDRTNDTYIGYKNHSGGLGVNQTYAETNTFTIPARLAGTFYVFGITDGGNYVYERGVEANNSAFDTLAMLVTKAPPADLVAGTITVPATGVPGQNATITYTVDNQGINPALGNWYDSLYLSVDKSWDLSDKLVGRVQHRGDVLGGASYTETLTAPLPGVKPGLYHVIVRSDILNHIPESSETNNAGASLKQASIDSAKLTPNVAANGHINPGQSIYYRVDVEAGETMVVTLDSVSTSDDNELFVRYNDMPSRSQFDFGFSDAFAPDQEIVVPFTRGGTYYILVHNVTGGNSDFTIKARILGFELLEIAPTSGSNKGKVTLTLIGSKFSPRAVAKLVPNSAGTTDPSNKRTATRMWWNDSSELWATFDLRTITPGLYDVHIDDTGQNTVLKGAFTATAGREGDVKVTMASPRSVRPGQRGILAVDYLNAGETNVMAPYIQIAAVNGVLRWPTETSATSGVEFLGISDHGPAGILPPGGRGRVSLIFTPTASAGQITFTASMISESLPANANVIDWNAFKEEFRPAEVTPDAWDVIYSNFTKAVGTTGLDLLSVLSDNANHLSLVGDRVASAGVLLGFEVVQADGLSTVPVLAGSVEAVEDVVGPDLAFARFYRADISRRFELGPMGRGWQHSWEVALGIQPGGDVIFDDEIGLRRVYELDTSGAYVPPLGINEPLVKQTDGTFTLQRESGKTLYFLSDGRLDFVEDHNGNRTAARYDSSSRLTSLKHTSGGRLDLTYNTAGRLSRVADSAGRGTDFVYDSAGYLTKATNFRGEVSRYAYETNSALASRHALRSVEYPDTSHQFFEYDSLGRLSTMRKDGGAEKTTFAYDSAGRVTVTDALGGSGKLYFNQHGRIVRISDPLDRVIRMEFDQEQNLTQVVNGAGFVVSYEYDANNNVESVTDPLGQVTQYEAGGGPLDLTATTTDANNHEVAYTYDTAGNIASSVFEDGTVESYNFDGRGLLTGITNRRGQTVTYTHDTAGRVVTKKTSATSTYAYDSRGNLATSTTPDGAVTRQYDSLDRVTRITYPGGQYLDFTYDSAGRRTSMSDQLGNSINAHYDSVGRLQRMTDKGGASVVTYTYDATGRVVTKQLANGVKSNYTYDASDRITRLENRNASSTVLSFMDYKYDLSARISSINTEDGLWTYTYDAVGQLAQAKFASVNSSIANQDLQYFYDAVGNRTRTVLNGNTTAYTSNDLNEYTNVGAVSYAYDADGNLTTRTQGTNVTKYNYDMENRLVGIDDGSDVWSYAYDAMGHLASTTKNGVSRQMTTDPDGIGTIVGEYDSSGNLIARYDYGFRLLRQMDGSGDASYFTGSDSGNISELTNAQGTAQATYFYGPFGDVINSAGSPTDPHRFVGEFGVRAEGPGLYHMRNRFYSPELGQFLTEDPMRFMIANNRLYAGNDPIMWIDPEGLVSWGTVGRGLLGLAGGVIEVGVGVVAVPATGGTSALLGIHGAYSIGANLGNIVNGFMETEPTLSGNLFQDGGKGLDAAAGTQVFEKIGNIGDLALGFYNPANVPTKVAAAVQSVMNSGLTTYDAIAEINRKLRGTNYHAVKVGDKIVVIARPSDPNDIIGPKGFGDENWVTANETLAYKIRFENMATATAPAQVVTVTHPLDPDLDWRTFRVGSFGWGGMIFEVPENSSFYNQRLDLTKDHGFHVDVSASINIATGEAFWTVATVDPATGETPEDPLIGFLPPNNDKGVGDAFLTYTIRASRTAVTGDVIDAKARIIFDTEEPIDTPPIFNTIDAGMPTSAVSQLPTNADSKEFKVSWTGQDDEGGSALTDFTVLVSDNGGDFTPWLEDTALTEGTFVGVKGHVYSFYTQARDNAGNVEDPPDKADALTSTAEGTGAISGQKFFDSNGNGVKDAGESGLSGWTIFIDADDDGVLDTGETSVVTGTDGSYSFPGLASSTYVIREVLKTSWSQTRPTSGSYKITLGDGEQATSTDFGNRKFASIAGVKFNDLNRNGVQDTGELGLPGWTIFLDTDNDGVLDAGETSVVTDTNGNYLFGGLASSTYMVREVSKTSWTQSRPSSGVHIVTLSDAQQASGIDFGNYSIEPPPIPTANQWGLLLMAALFVTVVSWRLRNAELGSSTQRQ